MNIAAIGILVSLIIAARIVPVDPKSSWWNKISIYLQWVLVPIVSITLSAIPAIDAQTRLLLNKRLDFKVTEKTRSKT